MISLRTHCYKLCIFLLFSVLYINAQETEIEVTDFFAKVYLAPNEKSKFIGLAQRGERYFVVNHNDTWVRIRFKGAIGWVYSSQVGPVGGLAAKSEEDQATNSDTEKITDSAPKVAPNDSEKANQSTRTIASSNESPQNKSTSRSSSSSRLKK